MQILDFLASVPGLGMFVMLSGILMIGLDVKKLIHIANTGEKDFKFYYILPGITFFTIGFFAVIR